MDLTIPRRNGSPNYHHTRITVFERDGNKCLRCLGDATVVHHRRVKGMGGSRSPQTHGLANLISLCSPCHEHIHANPAESYELGFLVSKFNTPSDVPVMVGTRQRMFLSDDGSSVHGTEYVWGI
jgi:5-methylcytosine-specific restriction enzyme A